MHNNILTPITKGFVVATAVLAVVGCGSSGGGSSSSSDSNLSTTVSSSSSSDTNTTNSSSVISSSFSSNGNGLTTDAPSRYTSVTVSDAYVLGAVVKINGVSNDIDAGDGVYEWLENYSGAIVTEGGANDLAAPFGDATADDPAAFTMKAPQGYAHVNPFTTLMVEGAVDLNTTYPLATQRDGEDGLIYNFDVVAAGAEDIRIAKEAAKAALAVSYQYTTQSTGGSASSVADTSDGTGDGLSINKPSVSSSSSAAPISGDPFPQNAAGRATAAPEEQIDSCGTVTCINEVLLSVFMSKFGAYEAACVPLPGVEACLNYAPVQAQETYASSSSSSVASSVASSSSSSTAPVQDTSNLFPSTQK